MLRKPINDIKIEEKEEGQTFPTRWMPEKFIKIEYDPQEYPPVKWKPLIYRNNNAENNNEIQNPIVNSNTILTSNVNHTHSHKPNWVKVMKKLLTRLLASYLGERQFKKFCMRFKKWRRSSTFIFAILMYARHHLLKEKNHFCDSYRAKIEEVQAEAVDQVDANLLHDSISIVVEFFIGEPIVAIEEFYRKHRSGYDSLKAKRFIKILQRAVSDEKKLQELQLEFSSAQFYEEDWEPRHKEDNLPKQNSNSGMEGESSNMEGQEKEQRIIDQDRKGKDQRSEESFLIYRREDPSKAPLYPVASNFTVKNAFNDLFQV